MKLLRFYLLFVIVSTLLFVSCKDPSSSAVDDFDEDEIVINPNTKPIDELNWIDSIQKIDSTNFTITFDASFDEAETWQEGDLLVSAIGDGLLRTVTGVSSANGVITVTTEQATLVDYIHQGRISERVSLGIDDVQKVTYLKEGVLLLQEPYELKAHKLYAEKAKGLPWKLDTKFSGDGSIDVFGEYLLETDLIFELDVAFLARLRYFEMSYELKNTLAIGMKAEQNLKVSSSADIAKVKFHPIIIIVPALPAPIVIVPTLVVSIGVDGEVTGEIYTDVKYENKLQVGTAFQRGEGWKEILERDDSFEYNPPTFGLDAKVEASLSAKYNMAVYQILSGYLTSTIYCLAEVGFDRDPWWELFLGLRGGIGISAKIVSIELFDINKKDFIDFRWSLAQAAADKVPITTIETIDQVTVSSARVTGKVEREPDSTPITYRGVCWSESNNPTTSDDCIQEGSGDGSFTTTITGLSSGTQYYIRTYATNNAGTAYSTEKALTTEEGQSLATITTSEITSVTSNSAQSGGNVTNDGGSNVTARGLCWSTSQNPGLNDSCISAGSGVGEFTSNISGLFPNRSYYVRAYATNETGTSYGNQRNFLTDDGIEDVPPEVNDFMTPEEISTLQNKGLEIYTGLNPSNIEGYYYADSQMTMDGNMELMNYWYRFHDQTSDLSIKSSHRSEDGTDRAEGQGAFIAGSGNTFSVYMQSISEIQQETHVTTIEYARIYSGIISSEGIKNFQFGFIITDKQNDINNEFMNIGDARVIYESDGLAKRVDGFRPPAKILDSSDLSSIYLRY